MCTAITYQPRELYMGRSLDYEASYGEEIVMLPRRFPLRFRHGGGSEQGYAILGTAHVADGYPLKEPEPANGPRETITTTTTGSSSTIRTSSISRAPSFRPRQNCKGSTTWSKCPRHASAAG